VSRDDRFFLMGSCFAEDIRHALSRELGEGQVGPDYRRIVFDPALAQVDGLPDHNHMNTYNAFSVLQQMELILGLWSPDPDDWWQVGEALQCSLSLPCFRRNARSSTRCFRLHRLQCCMRYFPMPTTSS
jgi:hypothetical protein